ncbi:MAG: hypothetical protein ACRC2R_25675 [Xenococcaceae cyanobacterium]
MSSELNNSQNLYKSRFLNFLNRQAIQIGDRLGVAFRNLKVATEWGVQVVLYPIYLAVQAGRSTGKQIGQRITISFSLPSAEDSGLTGEDRLSIIDCDRPIDKVLKAIEPSFEVNGDRITPTIDRVQGNAPTFITSIQGIASVLETQKLVLVDRDNHILDILNSQQQQKLKQSIILEVANYYCDRRLIRETQSKFLGYLPSIDTDNSKVLPPVRLFWKVMDWEQHSSVAMAIDLFGESSLVPHNSSFEFENVSLSDRQQLQLTQVLTTIDDKIAELEVKQLSPVVESLERFGDNWQEIRQRLQSNSQIDLNDSDSELVKSNRRTEPQLVTRLGSSLQQLSQKIQSKNSNSATNRENTASDPFQIQAIIWAAIDYFFGDRRTNPRLQDKFNSSKSLGDSEQQVSLQGRNSYPSLPVGSDLETEEDPWLAWEDLYEDFIPTDEESIEPILPGNSRRQSQLKGANIPNTPQNTSSNEIKRSLQRQRQNALRVRETRSGNLVKQNKKSTEVVRSAIDSNSISNYQSPNLELDNNADERDWWEVKSTKVGYERHPLAIVISLLDRVILFVEEIFLSIWRRIKRLFRG